MTNRAVAFILLLLTSYNLSQAQECMGLKIKLGAGYEMTLYDSKDNATGTLVCTYKTVHQQGRATVIDVETQMTTKKGKSRPISTIHYTCTGNQVTVDGAGMGGASPGLKDLEVKVLTNDIWYPKTLQENTTLADGTFATQASSNGTTMMSMNVAVTNRKVEGKQSMSTPAGTFTVYKITANMALENKVMGMPMRKLLHSTSYRANDVLYDIRTETFDKNGVLSGYTLLTKLF